MNTNVIFTLVIYVLVEFCAPPSPYRIMFVAGRAPRRLKPKAQKIDKRHTNVITLREGLVGLITSVPKIVPIIVPHPHQ